MNVSGKRLGIHIYIYIYIYIYVVSKMENTEMRKICRQGKVENRLKCVK
jgi:hypothetical protein